MAIDSDLKAVLEELLAPMGPVSIRRMFGGGGVFLDGLMFGLVVEDVLYFKADDGNRALFDAEGLAPFTYQKKTGVATLTSYRQSPERLLDEPDELVTWAQAAYAAARRARKPARPRNRQNPAAAANPETRVKTPTARSPATRRTSPLKPRR